MSASSTKDESAKICCRCGKDVSQAKRLRDDAGYWCYDCHAKDRNAKHPPTALCDDCGRTVRVAGLSEIDGVKVCKFCFEERQARRKFAPISLSHHEREDHKRLLIMSGVMFGLIALVVLHHFGIIPRLF